MGDTNILAGIGVVITVGASFLYGHVIQRPARIIDQAIGPEKTYRFANDEVRERFEQVLRPYMETLRDSQDMRDEVKLRKERDAIKDIAEMIDKPRYHTNRVIDEQEILWAENPLNREEIRRAYKKSTE